MRVVEHESLEELQAVTKRERDGRVRLRLQGVVLARQGRSARVIGQSLGVSPRPARAPPAPGCGATTRVGAPRCRNRRDVADGGVSTPSHSHAFARVWMPGPHRMMACAACVGWI